MLYIANDGIIASNYMFRPLMAIIRLYILVLSSYTIYKVFYY